MAAPRIKLTGSLADVAALRKNPSVLIAKISEHLMAENAKPSDRRQDIIHPSEMAAEDWCPRQTYYRIRDVKAGLPYVGEKFSAGTLLIFEEGHAIHAKWQGWLKDMGLLHGKWRCRMCGELSEIGSVTDFCWTCDEPRDEYAEVPLSAEETHLIAGHADGYVPDLDALIEIKSVGLGTLRMDVPELLREYTVKTVDGAKIIDIESVWRNLHEPLKPHVKQAVIYLWMARLAGLKASRMIFLYESKANQQVKEFIIGLDVEVLNPMLTSATEIKLALEGSLPPPNRAHQVDSAKCKKCPFSEECHGPNQTPPISTTILSDTTSDGHHGGERAPAPRPPRRRDSTAPGRRDGAARRRSDGPVPPDGGVEPVRGRTVRHRGGS